MGPGKRARRSANAAAGMTKRVEEALRNPYVSCLSHPKGRIINRRPENALDLERVYEVAVQQGVALEVNGLPDRLDLRSEHIRDALSAGVQIVCSTDSHSMRGLENMSLSVMTAREAGRLPRRLPIVGCRRSRSVSSAWAKTEKRRLAQTVALETCSQIILLIWW